MLSLKVLKIITIPASQLHKHPKALVCVGGQGVVGWPVSALHSLQQERVQ